MLSAELAMLFKEGFVVALVGIGVVFSFLTILVFAMSVMSPVVCYLNKIFPVKVLNAPVKANKNSSEDEIAIAIAIAAVQ